MGPASLQKDSEPPPPPQQQQSEGEMESYRCLLQAGSQLESTLQREYATRDAAEASFNLWLPLPPSSLHTLEAGITHKLDLQFSWCPHEKRSLVAASASTAG